MSPEKKEAMATVKAAIQPEAPTAKQEKKLFAIMVEGKYAQAKTYDKYEIAESEAKKLSLKQHKTVYVLSAIAKLEFSDIKVTQL